MALRAVARRLAVVFLASGLAAASAGAAATSPRLTGSTIVPPIRAPEFRLHDQHGRTISLAALQGKVVLVTFLYTHCPDLCPLTAVDLNRVLELVGSRRKEVAVLAVSVDPRGDTPRAVARFIRSHRLSPEFHYLTGSPGALESVWQAYNVSAVGKGGTDVDHTLYTLLIDKHGMSRVVFGTRLKPVLVAHDVGLLLD